LRGDLPHPSFSRSLASPRLTSIAVHHSELLFEGFPRLPDNLLLCEDAAPSKFTEDSGGRGVLPQSAWSGAVNRQVTTVVSPAFQQETLSLGCLLAAIERSLPVCHVEAGTYLVSTNAEGRLEGDARATPTEIWLAGEPYLP